MIDFVAKGFQEILIVNYTFNCVLIHSLKIKPSGVSDAGLIFFPFQLFSVSKLVLSL